MGKLHIDIPQEKIAEFRKKWKLSEFTFFGSANSGKSLLKNKEFNIKVQQ